MVTRTAAEKTLRLMSLENWARDRYAPKAWGGKPFKDALKEYCLITWATSDGGADNMANIVQLRLTRRIPKLLRQENQVEDGLSVLEIISGHRQAHPEDYKAPATEFKIIEE